MRVGTFAMDPHTTVELRLRKRGAAVLLSAAAFSAALVASLTLHKTLKHFGVLSMWLARLPVTCISPGTSDGDLSSPALVLLLFNASSLTAAVAIAIWLSSPPSPCGAIVALPGTGHAVRTRHARRCITKVSAAEAEQ